jgi:GT2 family glycosyltransferase
LLPDYRTGKRFPKTTIIPTGPVYPSIKRNIGVSKSRAEFCAFIDSDAWPAKDWLSSAVRIMKDNKIGAVGGPNLVPPGSPLKEQVGTDIIFSRMGVGAFPSKKYKNMHEVNEMPASNLIVRTKLLKQVGGFDTTLLTAEDAKLCFQIKNAGFKVVYSNDVAVYHHRRHFLIPYLKSIRVYGRDKAFLLKELFSIKRLYYFIPSLFLIGLIAGFVVSLFSKTIGFVYTILVSVYLCLAFLQALMFKGLLRKALIFVGIPLTHFTYGYGFLEGLFTKRHR